MVRTYKQCHRHSASNHSPVISELNLLEPVSPTQTWSEEMVSSLPAAACWNGANSTVLNRVSDPQHPTKAEKRFLIWILLFFPFGLLGVNTQYVVLRNPAARKEQFLHYTNEIPKYFIPESEKRNRLKSFPNHTSMHNQHPPDTATQTPPQSYRSHLAGPK